MGKLIDGGSVPKDSPLFKRGWIFGGRRLTDLTDEAKERAEKESSSLEKSKPLCADPEDYDKG